MGGLDHPAVTDFAPDPARHLEGGQLRDRCALGRTSVRSIQPSVGVRIVASVPQLMGRVLCPRAATGLMLQCLVLFGTVLLFGVRPNPSGHSHSAGRRTPVRRCGSPRRNASSQKSTRHARLSQHPTPCHRGAWGMRQTDHLPRTNTASPRVLRPRCRTPLSRRCFGPAKRRRGHLRGSARLPLRATTGRLKSSMR